MIKPVFVARICFVPLALAASMPLLAQMTPAASPASAPSGLTGSDDPAALLSENLKALARDPYNVDALLQAGQGALAVGDPNAAFGFFARAEELSPSNWRAKAGLGSCLTMMEKSRDALRLFDESMGLGAPELDIAADRGLAHDLEGDGKKAQRDYLAALKARPSDEVTRRLALSLGIGGDKDAALARLEALLRRNDQGAWRARAFILAMNGDMPGAEKIVRMVVPAEAAGSMTGFLQRLASLNPAARAHAVHFGSLPSSGQTSELAMLEDDGFRPLDPAAAARLVTPDVERKAPSASTTVDPRMARRQMREQRDLVRLADRGRRAVEQTAPVRARAGGSPATGVQSKALAAALPSGTGTVSGSLSAPLAGSRPDPASGTSVVRAAPQNEGAAALVSAPIKVAEAPSLDARPAPLFEVPPSSPKQATVAPAGPASQTSLNTPITSVKPAVLPPSTAPQMTLAGNAVAASVDVPLASSAPQDTPASAALPTALGTRPAVGTPSSSVIAQVENRGVYGPQAEPSASAPSPTPRQVVAEPALASAGNAPLAASAPPIDASETPAAQPPVARAALSLSDIVRTLELEPESQPVALPDAAKLRTMQLAAQKKAAAEEKARAERREEERREAEEAAKARRHPARTWVQVATGNNTQGLPGTWRSIKSRTAKALDGQKAWFVPFRQTNRLLVGPVKSASEARALVNSLAKEGLQATIFSSEAGQEIERIGGK